jgi:hypothetical protein
MVILLCRVKWDCIIAWHCFGCIRLVAGLGGVLKMGPIVYSSILVCRDKLTDISSVIPINQLIYEKTHAYHSSIS